MKKNEKGATSIIWVIIILISTIIITGFIGILTRTLALNEIQGIMDMSGVSALRYSTEDIPFRSEETASVDAGAAKEKYEELLKSSLEGYVGENKMIKDYKIENVTILRDSQTTLGPGGMQGKKEGDEYFLESVVTATYGLNSVIDQASIHVVNYFDFLWAGENATVSIRDDKGDGEGNIVIRTVSRLAIR